MIIIFKLNPNSREFDFIGNVQKKTIGNSHLSIQTKCPRCMIEERRKKTLPNISRNFQ